MLLTVDPELRISSKAGFLTKEDYSFYIKGTFLNTTREKVLEDLCTAHFDPVNLNGVFLIVIVDHSEETIRIITDRFGYFSLFYYLIDQKILISDTYSDISSSEELSLNKFAYFEYFSFNRLFGRKTFDEKTFSTGAAADITVSYRDFKLLNNNRYWTPQYSANSNSLLKNAEILVELLRQSAKRYTAESREFGLLLSGGLDSRCVLSAMDIKPECYTMGPFKNNEFDVAALVAATSDCNHHFLERNKDYYEDIFHDGVKYGGCFCTFDHGTFFLLKGKLQSDVIFHGHGLDYMFQGMYLPIEPKKIMGQRSNLVQLKEIKNFKDSFIESVKYKIDKIAPESLLKKESLKEAEEFIYNSISSMEKEGRECGCDDYQLFDYSIMSDISRHYTHLNLKSLRTFTEERSIAFDNDLYDFFLEIPVDQKVGLKLFKETLKILSPELASIRNANNNLPADWSPRKIYYKRKMDAARAKIGLKRKYMLPPKRIDRSWPDRDTEIRDNTFLKSKASNLYSSEELNSLNLFDMNRIENLVNGHMNGSGNYSSAIMNLITIDGFFKI